MTDRATEKKERLERTNAADARKAREVVREAATHSLLDLAERTAKVTAEQQMKHRLEEAAAGFRLAVAAYAKEELKAPGFTIEWMGGRPGLMPPMPEWVPGHKVELALAWNEMLRAVNEATKVGVHKLNRYRPIELQVDLDDGPKLIIGGVSWN